MGKKSILEGLDKDEETTKLHFMKDLKEQRKKLISHKPKPQELYYIFHLILNQSRFTYSTCLALGYYVRCFACRRRSKLKRIKAAK